MTGKELLKHMEEKRTIHHCFIRWWRENRGIIDIELLDTFLDRAKAGDEFDAFELLDMEDMLGIVMRQFPGKVKRTVTNGNDNLTWEINDSKGSTQQITRQFVPEFLINVYAVETSNFKNK